MAPSLRGLCTDSVYTENTGFFDGSIMKNITLSADASLIEAARARARAEQTTLNAQFRRWLAGYAQTGARMDHYDTVMQQVRGKMKVGRPLSREAMNER